MKMSLTIAPSTQFSSGKAGSKLLKQKAGEFLQCTRSTNVLLELIAYQKECLARGAPLTPSLLTLEHLFTELLRRDEMRTTVAAPSRTAGVPLENGNSSHLSHKQWLLVQYKESFGVILASFNHEKPADACQALSTAMKLLVAEAQNPVELPSAPSEQQQQFPVGRLKQILSSMLSSERLNTHLFNRFLEYSHYLDVIYFCWKLIPSLVPRDCVPNDVFTQNLLLLIGAVSFGKDALKETNNVLCVPLAGPFDYVFVRRQINKTWNFVVNWPHGEAAHQQLLLVLLEKVLPHLEKPVLLTDFLMDSLDVGGAISMLALQGIFVLIQQYNLTYPNIYEKLYSMFEPEIFHTKFKARLFYLADIFLSSSHLPEGLVAAFVKRLARLALIAPPQDVVIIMRFIGNLILRHPALKSLIFHPAGGEASSDPFVTEERDPMKSKALLSSLWEVAALQNHVLPSVAMAARFISNPFPSVEWDLSSVLEINENDIFDNEIAKKTKQYALCIDRPAGMFGYCGGEISSQYWKLF
ncbi:nucleolar complex protein 4 homolog A [Anopheles aquasalis]|uniref:nucleolar complex protein 4 homolog A n=1 Tax=Anopheles aquasalis TaxID=42839 RepID=UPI00215B5440|nr:nucleolar complex protein 4 homolog A [Anopheles aquasalis]